MISVKIGNQLPHIIQIYGLGGSERDDFIVCCNLKEVEKLVKDLQKAIEDVKVIVDAWNSPIRDPSVKKVIIECPECGRMQEVDVEFYNMSLTGHHLTCNGGNPDYNSHHDHEVIMVKKTVIKGKANLEADKEKPDPYKNYWKSQRAANDRYR